MEYKKLGNTDLKVSSLCFGSLSISELQSNLPIEIGSEVIVTAMDLGVNFLDTAEFYNNYRYIGEAVKRSNKELIIASKSYAYTYEGMKVSVEKARRETGKDVIDIFMLHEQESRWTLKGHREALEFLLDAKSKGLIKAVGVSTHAVEVVEHLAEIHEIDVIHPILNVRGIGIKGGNTKDMENAIKKAFNNGKGIYVMKCLGGGNLIQIKEEAFDYIKKFQFTHSTAVGMKSQDEVLANVMIFEGKSVPAHLCERLERENRRLIIEDWCEGCGTCVQHCRYGALHMHRGKAQVDLKKCVLCGYCSGYCPEFCIKII